VLHLKSKLFWDGVEDDSDRPVIAHDVLHKLHPIEIDEEDLKVIRYRCMKLQGSYLMV
jgi:hypothetical protein